MMASICLDLSLDLVVSLGKIARNISGWLWKKSPLSSSLILSKERTWINKAWHWTNIYIYIYIYIYNFAHIQIIAHYVYLSDLFLFQSSFFFLCWYLSFIFFHSVVSFVISFILSFESFFFFFFSNNLPLLLTLQFNCQRKAYIIMF